MNRKEISFSGLSVGCRQGRILNRLYMTGPCELNITVVCAMSAPSLPYCTCLIIVLLAAIPHLICEMFIIWIRLFYIVLPKPNTSITLCKFVQLENRSYTATLKRNWQPLCDSYLDLKTNRSHLFITYFLFITYYFDRQIIYHIFCRDSTWQCVLWLQKLFEYTLLL